MTLRTSLNDQLRNQLSRIEPSVIRGTKYYPCSVQTADAKVLPCVYIVEENGYFRHWGVWPEEDSGKLWIRLEEVKEISSSPFRLPTRFAAQIYQAGESGMGYHVFALRFLDGSVHNFMSGGGVDFIALPRNLELDQIVEVLTKVAVPWASLVEAPKYYWCLYSAQR